MQALQQSKQQLQHQAQQYWVKTTDGEQLFAQSFGDASKPAMVLVHGYPDNQEVWELVIPHLLNDFYVISYDVRGAGRSTIPKKVSSYRLPQLSKDLNAVVEQVIPNRQFHLAAHDWGSIQTWESVTEESFRGKILSYSTISGPCLDHAQHYLQKAKTAQPLNALKMLSKSWYIAVFHLPLLAPTYWRVSSVNQWQKFINNLEKTKGLPVSQAVLQDGQHGIALYRANFIPTMLKPRKRYAQCPVQAIVLKRDRFVSPEYIDEVQHWADDFSRVEVDANHWAILSQPQRIAQYISDFAMKY